MFKRAKSVVATFTKGKEQLDPVDVETTKGIANVRIHVERVIGFCAASIQCYKEHCQLIFLNE